MVLLVRQIEKRMMASPRGYDSRGRGVYEYICGVCLRAAVVQCYPEGLPTRVECDNCGGWMLPLGGNDEPDVLTKEKVRCTSS